MAAQPQTMPANPAPPAPNAQAANPAPADQATAAAQPSGGDQVAAVVTKEFPTYDKNSDGTLSKTEFSAWMLALKSASDPSTKADDPKTKTWMTQAFAQADSDKSKSVSKDELTNFLAQASKS
jgi:Ca2+-binding EF-hand superfamily protein